MQAEQQRLYETAAVILEEAGQIDDAADALLIAKNYDHLARFLLVHATPLIDQGRYRIVQRWLEKIPPEILDASTGLLIWSGRSRHFFDSVNVLHLAERVYDQFTLQMDHLGQVVACSTVIACIGHIITMRGVFPDIDIWIQRLESHLEVCPDFPSIDLELTIAVEITLAIYNRDHHLSSGFKFWMNRAMHLARKTKNFNQEMTVLCAAANCCYHAADHVNHAVYISQADELSRSAPLSPPAQTLWHATQYIRMTVQGIAPEQMLRFASVAMAFAEKNGLHIFDQVILSITVFYSFAVKDLEKTAELLEKLNRATNPQSSRQMATYQIFAAWYHVLKGDLSQALSIAQRMPELLPESPANTHIEHNNYLWVLAQIYWGCGKHEAAFRKLIIYRDFKAKSVGAHTPGWGPDLMEAQFLLGYGLEEPALKSLAKALAIGREQHFIPRMVAMPGDEFSALCAMALTHGIEVNYVRQLIRRLKLRPKVPPLEIPHWPWPISIATLGRFELLIDDEPVAMTRMKKTPLLLLKAIIALGGENVRIDTLSEWLWPETEGDAAYNAFRTTLSRLRRLLRFDNVILSHEGAVSLDAYSVWIDTWAFERIRSIANSSRQDIGELFRQIRQLYQGEFLPRENDFWMISPRERIRDQYLRQVARFGEALEKQKRWQGAVACYRACLDADDLSEQIYQRLMTCYWRLGDKSAAASTYKRLRKILKSQLDVAPSSGTEVLYRRIVAES